MQKQIKKPACNKNYRLAERIWWREKDSNLRRRSQRIYSPSPLATREPLHKCCQQMILYMHAIKMSTAFFYFFRFFISPFLPACPDTVPACVLRAAEHYPPILRGDSAVLQFPDKIYLPDTAPQLPAPEDLKFYS